MVSIKKYLLFTLIIGICVSALVRTAACNNLTTCHDCESCDSYGAKKDTFSPNEDVYVNGSGFAPCTTFDLYVVCDKLTWSDGDTIPPRVAGTATTVSSDSSGNIPPTIVWPHNLTPGKYDIVIDANCNGKYDKDIDCLDDNDVQVTAGFFIIPEYILGSIAGLAACFAGFGTFRKLKNRQKDR